MIACFAHNCSACVLPCQQLLERTAHVTTGSVRVCRQQAAAWSGVAPAPPPTGAPPPPQPPQYPAGSGYAAAPTHSLPTDTGNTSQQQQYAGSYTSASSYTSVPPPASLTSSSHVPGGGGRRPFSIRPQVPKPKPPESSSPLVAAFNQAAAKIGSSSTAPAYTRVQVGTASQQQQTAAAPVGPQQWPPALKAYVERAFKGCDLVSGGLLLRMMVWRNFGARKRLRCVHALCKINHQPLQML